MSCLWFVVCGLWFVACGLWLVVCGLWFVVCDLWFVTSSFWFAVWQVTYPPCKRWRVLTLHQNPHPLPKAKSPLISLRIRWFRTLVSEGWRVKSEGWCALKWVVSDDWREGWCVTCNVWFATSISWMDREQHDEVSWIWPKREHDQSITHHPSPITHHPSPTNLMTLL